MINLSEIFTGVGVQNGMCVDVATGLGMQGINQEISIPVYEVFYIKIMPVEKARVLCSSIPEFTALRNLSSHCGAVAITINIGDIDFLTLMGAMCIFTPGTGFNIFFKNNIVDLVNATEDIVEMLLSLSGLNIDLGMSTMNIDIAAHALQILTDKLIEQLHDDFCDKGINVVDWSELPNLYNELKRTNEMNEMYRYRQANGLPRL